MKYLGLTAAVVLAFASCSKKSISETEEESPHLPGTPATTAPAASPAESSTASSTNPAVKPESPPSVTSAPELAPDGIFYLIAAARVETSSGVLGLPPGTGVKRVRPGFYLTPAGEVALTDAQLTNDLAVARTARDAALAEQAALKQRGAADVKVATLQSQVKAKTSADTQAVALAGIERERLARDVAAFRLQISDVESQVRALENQQSKESYNRVWKGRTTASTTTQQLNSARNQLQTLVTQLSITEQALRASYK